MFLQCCKHSFGRMGACSEGRCGKQKDWFSAGSGFAKPAPCAITGMAVPAAKNVVAPKPEHVSGREIWADVPAS